MSFVGLTRFGGFARILVVGEAGEVDEICEVGEIVVRLVVGEAGEVL